MNGPFRIFAGALLDAGYSPLPVIPGRKKPALRAWSNFCVEPMPRDRIEDYGARWPRASLGVALGYAGVIALDVDTGDAAQLAAICATVPASPVAKTGAKGFTAFYRAAPGASIPSRHYAASHKQGICDLLSTGTQTVLPPSPHPAGHTYRWLTADTLLTVRASDLPEAPADIAERLETALAPWMPRPRFQVTYTPRIAAPEGFDLRRLTAFAKSGLARRARELASTAEGCRNNELFSLGAGLGKYVFHGLLAAAVIEKTAIAACGVNGLLREDGRLAVLASLHKGLARAKADPLPLLKERRT
jgi:Bifunctional DNA primase/polymerase, N-terminal